MVKLLLLLLTLLTLKAQETALIYQSQGLEAVRDILDRELMEEDFWLKHLQTLDTSFGYLEGRNSFVACNKSDNTLTYFQRSKQGIFERANTFDALTGKVDGDKEVEGDHKTPIGIYRLTRKLDKLDPFYGPLAYVTSYPNLYDRIRGKNGSGIWIHGVPNNETRETSTKGCIALNNNDLLCLDEQFDFKNSLLIIDEKLALNTDKRTLAKILSQLFKWRYAWIYNDLESYLSFYAPDFKRFDGKNFKQFKTYKERVFAKKESKEIFFKQLTILPYPGSDNQLFMISFYETYYAPTYNFEGEKTLMVRFDGNMMQIIAEQ